MSKPYIHALNSVKKFGGHVGDYIEIHEFMDSSKSTTSTHVHRALTHNSWFISFIVPRVFGETFQRKSDNKTISTRDIAEAHVAEDFGGKFIPSASDYLDQIVSQEWMIKGDGIPPSLKNVKKQKVNID